MPRGCSALLLSVCSFAFADAPQKPAPSEMQRAVEEFKILTRNLGLREGSRPKHRGGLLREYHGRVFENFRNDFLDAIPHEIRQVGGDKSVLRRNQFGFNVAGPLRAGGGTFVSLSYEGVRERISRTYLRTIPTLPEHTGDYAHVVDEAGNLLPIYDPNTTAANPNFDSTQPVTTANLQYLRDPFPGNRIPASRLDPVAQKALAFYPAPNAAVGPFFRNNYFIDSPETNTANGMIGKLDQSLRERHHLSTELAFSNGLLGSAQWFPSAANPGAPDRRFQSRRGALDYVFTASSHTVNTFTFEALSEGSRSGNALDQANYSDVLGLPGIGASFPVFRFTYLGMGHSYPLSENARNTYTWSDGVSTSVGKHTLRLSGKYTRYQVNTYWPSYPAGYFDFSAGLTSLPGIINTGHAFASYLLGLADFAQTSQVAMPSYFRRTQGRLALRDHYEARKGLVISLGLNIERGTPRVEKYDRQSTIDLNAVNPANGRPGALAAAGRDGYGRAFQPAWVRLEPSASITWNPGGDAKTVVRAAFARSYSAIPIYSTQWGTQGFNGYPTFISPNVQLAPALVLSGGVPPPANPLPDLRPEAANNTVADLLDTTDRLPTYQSASLTVERELPGSVVVRAGATYSGGKDLLVSNSAANPDALPLEYLGYRDLLNDDAFNRSLRPYPQFKGFDVYSSWPLGRYQRDAAFVSVEKRASRGLSLNAHYEFSKQMDDYSGPYGKQDFFNRQNEWSITAGSRPQYLTFGYLYEFPLGTDKPFLNFGDWRRYLVDGWSVSGMGTIYSGDPIYLRPEFNNTGGAVQALRVNVVPGADPNVSNQGPSLWYNPAAFEQPPDFTLGDGPRTHPTLRNPGLENFDITLSKRIAVAPERTVEFSAAAFDFMNHANWNDPDNVIGPASAPNVNAGKIIGSRGGRVIQLGLRFSF